MSTEVGALKRTGTPASVLVAAGLAPGCSPRVASHVPVLLNLTTFGGIWVCAAAAIGHRPRRPRQAAVGASLFLLAMIATFYATRAVVQSGGQARFLLFWSVLAVVAGPVFGSLGAVASRPSWLGATAAALLAGYLAGEAVAVGLGVRDPARFGLVAFDILAAALVVLLVPADAHRRSRTLLLLPLPLAAGTAVLAVVHVLARLGGL